MRSLLEKGGFFLAQPLRTLSYRNSQNLGNSSNNSTFAFLKIKGSIFNRHEKSYRSFWSIINLRS